MFRHTLLLNLLCVPYFAYSNIYQTCKWSEQPLTDRFIQSNQEFLNIDAQHTPDFICDKPVYNQYNPFQPVTDVLNTGQSFSIGPIPPICFLSSSARGTIHRPPSKTSHTKYYHCNSPENTNVNNRMAVKNPNTQQTHHIYLRSPCVTEEYHHSLVRTFNKMAYCFGLSAREARNLFAIINHESQFVPNVKSSTGARCAGQLTKPTVVTLNAHILEEHFPAFHIYQSVVSKCPSLVNKTIPPDILCYNTQPCPHSQLHSGNQSQKEKKLSQYPITCKLTSGLPQCFFYTFLTFKEALMNFDQNFKAQNEFDKQEMPEQFTQQYSAGLNPNEIIVAKTDNNPNTDDALLFITARSAYEEVQKYENQPNNPMYSLNVETVSIISEKDIETFKFFATQLSYNGGGSIVESQITNFLTFLKGNIDQADCSFPKNKYCNYRKQILSGRSLPLDAIKEDFEHYLRQAKRPESDTKMYPREETFTYPSDIQKSINYFQNSDGVSRANLKNLATRHLKTDKVSPKVEQQIRKTVEDIKNQCQIPIL